MQDTSSSKQRQNQKDYKGLTQSNSLLITIDNFSLLTSLVSRETQTPPVMVRLVQQIVLIALAVVMAGFLTASPSPRQSSQPKNMLSKTCTLSPSDREQLEALELQGYLTFDNTSVAADDWGGIWHLADPAAVAYPTCVEDIMGIVQVAAGSVSGLTVGPRGYGHSVGGQSQAPSGVVIDMSSLRGIRVMPHGDHGRGVPYVEASGGERWVDVLKACLEHDLAPRSWTDYLYLSVGGTLSNAGISGQTFRYGPQVSNVLQLEVVTGKGELVECSPKRNAKVFYAVLGGLGQFGIITKARIFLEHARQRVRWIRATYTDFAAFKKDQEMLISASDSVDTFDYIEGFVVINNNNTINGWGSIPFNVEDIHADMIPPIAGSVLYVIEATKTYDVVDLDSLNQKVERMLAPLSFHQNLLFTTDVTYFDFLDRIHVLEVQLRSLGLWDIPHPWLNLFVPASAIETFDALVLKKFVTDEFSGPILVYPMNKSKWDWRLSTVVPDEDIFYIVAFLRNKLPSATPTLASMIMDNDKIVGICEELHCKQYFPRYDDQTQWKRHFGSKWESFVHNKNLFDPQAILAPGQNIFSRRRKLIFWAQSGHPHM